VALAFGWLRIRVPEYWLSSLIFQFVFAGFGEEILQRGYFESRINAEFGRRLRFCGIRFGPGLIIVSVLFALGHVLNPFRPLRGSYRLSWAWGLSAGGAGLFFGLLRERTGSVLAPALFHGAGDVVLILTSGNEPARWIVISIAWSLSWFVLFFTSVATAGRGDPKPAPPPGLRQGPVRGLAGGP